MNQLEARLADLFSGGELIRMIFSSKRKKSVEYNKVSIRPVEFPAKCCFRQSIPLIKK